VTVAVADATVGYGQFKRVASEAVRVADMCVVVSEERRTRQSTLAKYLQLIGPLLEGSMFPNEFRPYLAGVVGRGAHQLKSLLRAGMLPLGRLESKPAAAGCCVMRKTLRTLCSRAVRYMQCGTSCTAGWMPSPRVRLVS
jgi:hypothetical protein